ncbi:MAG: biopolymer transporter ExbD [Treponema sp.]|jgi:biopolymer transport protein ExbD|nr:biopolymer transporter ExbD [Treponema sp.]
MKLKRKKKEFFIPLNSMSDVAFLLLIFIMIVALINYRKEVKIDYPEAQTALRTSDEKNMEVWINKEGEIFLDGDIANYSLLENKIAELYVTAPDTRVHIIADRSTPYLYINNALEILQLLQYRVVSFVVKNNE